MILILHADVFGDKKSNFITNKPVHNAQNTCNKTTCGRCVFMMFRDQTLIALKAFIAPTK